MPYPTCPFLLSMLSIIVPADTTSAASLSSLTTSVDLSPMPANVTEGKKFPMYAVRLRQVITEEGHSSTVLVHILQMIVRNRELFYTSRSLFMSIMLNSLTRLGLPSQSALENRILSVDLAATMLWWDQKAAEEQARNGGPSSMEVEAEKPDESKLDLISDTAHVISVGATRMTPAIDEMIVNFLLRMAFVRYVLDRHIYSALKQLSSFYIVDFTNTVQAYSAVVRLAIAMKLAGVSCMCTAWRCLGTPLDFGQMQC